MKALLLISGGFDSPVSGYLMQLKDVEIIALHLSYEPFTDNGPEIKSKKSSEILKFKKFIVKNIGPQASDIAKYCNPRLYFVLTKRLMMKIAEQTAKEEGCDFIITGENLSQVSSQTLSNLNAITEAVKMKIVRPLLTFEKIEILKIAREIGTHDVSIGPEVCDALGPKFPATSCSLDDVHSEEAKLLSKENINKDFKVVSKECN